MELQKRFSTRHRLIQFPLAAERDVESGSGGLTVDLAVRIELNIREGIELKQRGRQFRIGKNRLDVELVEERRLRLKIPTDPIKLKREKSVSSGGVLHMMAHLAGVMGIEFGERSHPAVKNLTRLKNRFHGTFCAAERELQVEGAQTNAERLQRFARNLENLRRRIDPMDGIM